MASYLLMNTKTQPSLSDHPNRFKPKSRGGMPALNDTTKTGVVNIQQTNYRTTTQNNIIEHYYTENGKEIPVSYSGGSSFSPTIQLTYHNNAENLCNKPPLSCKSLLLKSRMCKRAMAVKRGVEFYAWECDGYFGPSFNAINEMIKNAQTALAKPNSLTLMKTPKSRNPTISTPTPLKTKGSLKKCSIELKLKQRF